MKQSDQIRVHDSAWVAASAQLYGHIEIAEGASIWPNAVIRSECHHVRIGRMSNVQDFVMIHVGYDHPTEIGEFVSVTHHATIHGATIEDHCLIGINATLMDGCVIGRGSIVAPGCVVREGTVVPAGSIVAGIPGKVIRERDSAHENRWNAWNYFRNAAAYRRGEHRAWDGEEYEKFSFEMREKIARDRDLEGDQTDAKT